MGFDGNYVEINLKVNTLVEAFMLMMGFCAIEPKYPVNYDELNKDAVENMRLVISWCGIITIVTISKKNLILVELFEKYFSLVRKYCTHKGKRSFNPLV